MPPPDMAGTKPVVATPEFARSRGILPGSIPFGEGQRLGQDYKNFSYDKTSKSLFVSGALLCNRLGCTVERAHLVPHVTSDTFMLLNAAQTYSNKTLGTNLAAGNFKVTGAADPTDPQDYGTKKYIDDNDQKTLSTANQNAANIAANAAALAVANGRKWTPKIITSSYPMQTTDRWISVRNPVLTTVTVTLPPAAQMLGEMIVITDDKGLLALLGPLILKGYGSELIAGVNQRVFITPYASRILVSDGTSWSMFGGLG